MVKCANPICNNIINKRCKISKLCKNCQFNDNIITNNDFEEDWSIIKIPNIPLQKKICYNYSNFITDNKKTCKKILKNRNVIIPLFQKKYNEMWNLPEDDTDYDFQRWNEKEFLSFAYKEKLITYHGEKNYSIPGKNNEKVNITKLCHDITNRYLLINITDIKKLTENLNTDNITKEILKNPDDVLFSDLNDNIELIAESPSRCKQCKLERNTTQCSNCKKIKSDTITCKPDENFTIKANSNNRDFTEYNAHFAVDFKFFKTKILEEQSENNKKTIYKSGNFIFVIFRNIANYLIPMKDDQSHKLGQYENYEKGNIGWSTYYDDIKIGMYYRDVYPIDKKLKQAFRDISLGYINDNNNKKIKIEYEN